jgi:hypothetical protein
MEAVVTSFIADPEQDDEAHSEADGQSGNIDGSVELVLPQVAPGGFEVVSQHGDPFVFSGLMEKVRGYDQITGN